MTRNAIPLVDLRAQYETIKTAVDTAIDDVISNTAFVGGSHVSKFADEFASLSGAKHCIPVANGTDAIYIALRMLDIGPGDEVITVANSWISTSETITQTGAKAVFVDIDEYFHIDGTKIENAITDKTKAIVPVHLYGQPADMGAILDIAKKYDLKVVEDCAQAHLAQFAGKPVGTFAEAGTFSFYPGKNLGAYGDAGGIVTNSESLAKNCEMFANHGALVKHQHQIEGINSRLDGLQAAILRAKMPHLKDWTESRQSIADQYDARLASIPQIKIPKRRPDTTHSFHLYVIRTNRRDELETYLQSRGIGCAIHYPTPLPLLPAYAYLGHSESDFPEAASAAAEILSLPIYPELPESSVARIGDAIEEFFGKS